MIMGNVIVWIQMQGMVIDGQALNVMLVQMDMYSRTMEIVKVISHTNAAIDPYRMTNDYQRLKAIEKNEGH